MDQDPKLQPPYLYPFDEILTQIHLPTPDEDKDFYAYGVHPIFNAYTRLHALSEQPISAEIAFQLTRESHGSQVHTKHIAAFMQMHPEQICDLTDEERRFLLHVGIRNELSDIELKLIAHTHDLVERDDDGFMALLEQKQRILELRNALCERMPISQVPASYLK
jgi:hypothetical protein